MFGVSSLEVLQATFVNRCALQVYKTIEKIYENRCCGCKTLLENQDCLMLTKAEIMNRISMKQLSSLTLTQLPVICKVA